MNTRLTRGPLIAAGTTLGIGLGGFVDGILFHQIFQAHSMLSARYPLKGLPPEVIIRNFEINMFWDGLFHAFTWLMTVIGLTLLWRASQRDDVPWSTTTFVGALPFGWGLFNLVEGILDHHILHLHHVLETPEHLIYDLTFLTSGVIFMAIGMLLILRGRKEIIARTPSQSIVPK